MVNILFVCTGNIFRSMTAEKCFKDYIIKNKLDFIQVDSAGIGLVPQNIHPFVKIRLEHYNIKFNHKTKWLTKELVQSNDLIIALNIDHQKYIKEKFNLEVPLFNELVSGKSEGILDVEDFKLNSKENIEQCRQYVYSVVDYIYDSIPILINNLFKGI